MFGQHKQTQIVIEIRALIEELKKRRNVIDFSWIPSQSENPVELNVEANWLRRAPSWKKFRKS